MYYCTLSLYHYSVLADLIDICTPYPEIKAEDWEFPEMKSEEALVSYCDQENIKQFKEDLENYSIKLPPGYANQDEKWLGGVSNNI